VIYKEGKPLLAEAPLSSEQEEVDALLNQDIVLDELFETRYKATQSRTSSREKILKKPPRFRFVSEYNAAVYDPENGVVHEGSWSDLHAWIARDRGISKPSDSWNFIKRYFSCDVFCLRAVPGLRVIIMDTLQDFKAKDFATVRRLGYEIMSPEFHWLVDSPYTCGKYIEEPSSLARNY